MSQDKHKKADIGDLGTMVAYCAFICPKCMVGRPRHRPFRHFCVELDEHTRTIRAALLERFVRNEWTSVRAATKLMSLSRKLERTRHFKGW